MRNKKEAVRAAEKPDTRHATPTRIYLLSPTSRPEAKHLPMIRFTLLPQTIDFSRFDAIILTSRQGIVALDEVSGGAWKRLPVAAIGKQTAAEAQARGGKVIYVASKAYGDVLAKELAKRFKKLRWLYARPRVVVSKIAKELQEAGIEVEEAVVYETSCSHYERKQRPEAGAVLIFTAPSIVKCFFENFDWDESWKAVAIGNKTAQAFPNGVKPAISPSTSIDEAIRFSKNLVPD
ncbi:uroporphyrinogen-III synthase [Hydrogenimonas urashimensis]|uniref:uroporphyrinogen-III synthase n=1 Tax=Hydrogenimonas urashimensis TaxID=2740515 RepID=UPI001916A80A|nr:uroporphyrinogen-III synthase [Hydrogenimonas urashimensis]